MFTDESGVFHSAITGENKSAIIIHKSNSEVTVGFAKKRTANKRENSARQLAFSGVPATLVTNRHSQFVASTGKCAERVFIYILTITTRCS